MRKAPHSDIRRTPLVVTLQPPTTNGRLYPALDASTQIFELTSRVLRPWTNGADIDGRILFDTDEAFLLANVELVISRRLWREVSDIQMPICSKAADIQFTERTLRTKSFTASITVQTNRRRDMVLIRWGTWSSDAEWIRLSDDALALVADKSNLIGFFAKLSP
jgi:hypothetical protein